MYMGVLPEWMTIYLIPVEGIRGHQMPWVGVTDIVKCHMDAQT